MDFEKYKLLKNKKIAEILDGDETFGDFEPTTANSYFGFSNLKIGLPRLSGPEICDIAKMFGSTLEYDGKNSRWQYMFDLIDYGIQSERIDNILAYLFDDSNFVRNVNGLNKDEFKKFHSKSVESALERINAILHFGGNKLIIDSKRVRIVPINPSTPKISVKNVKTIDRDYIKSLSDRAIDNVENGYYDSALTQARTILEETFDYVLEKRNIEPSSKGDINKLYKQVKDEYKMHENKNADKRINRLLSGLENIVSAVSEMRNKNSDSHGVGERRLTIDKHHARLAVNSATTMADFILSVEKKFDGYTDY
ncbi:abortive infection family protein [Limosilactobacillus mucosae]|uniref:abortive infection family protein n=1 Tax=Limosilactobacillus mucosae TaxID=97478 RepID=UPI00233F1340|nr:abortive infection family protein [Limosilactobacillus mucosae]MDC2839770.1 abortive infection family protein [Limosilactobacillus mucosae]